MNLIHMIYFKTMKIGGNNFVFNFISHENYTFKN